MRRAFAPLGKENLFMFSVRLRVPVLLYGLMTFLILFANQAHAQSGKLCVNVKSAIASYRTNLANPTFAASNSSPAVKTAINNLEANCRQYDGLVKLCQESKDETDYNCAESNNKGLSQFSSMMGSVADMASMTMSQSCSKMAELLKIGNGALAGFRLQCLTTRGTCVEKCGAAEKIEKAIEKDLQILARSGSVVIVQNTQPAAETEDHRRLLNKENLCGQKENRQKNESQAECLSRVEADYDKKHPSNASEQAPQGTAPANSYSQFEDAVLAAQQELGKPTDPESPTALKRICNATAQEMTGKVGMNMVSLMSSMQQNTNCANELQNIPNSGIDLKDCNLTGTCTPTDPVSDCQDPAFKNSIYCQAGLNNSGGNTTTGGGLNGGLNGTNGGLNNGFADSGLLDSKGTLGTLDGNTTAGSDGGFDPNDPNNPLNRLGDGGGQRSAGVPGGGGGGGLGIPGGGYNPRGGGGGRGPSGEGTNFGGTPSYAAGGSYGGGSGNNKNDLDKYMPGGEKDPALNKKGIGPEGITAPGGLTLFEKVSKGYKNNRSTLMPE